MEILLIVIIAVLALLLGVVGYQYWLVSKKYKRIITPNWEKLDDRLINLGMAMVSQKFETEKLSNQIQEMKDSLIKNDDSNK
jgi:uncharacterized protein YneF (UPF0154 family)